MPRSKTSRSPVAAGSRDVAAAIAREQRVLARIARRLSRLGERDVHRGRVAARRIRSMLKTFRPLFDRRRSDRYRADLRTFARSLAAVREADVLATLLGGLASDGPGLDPVAHERLEGVLETMRREARDSLRTQMTGPESTRLRAAIAAHARDRRLGPRPDAGLPELLGMVENAWRKAVRRLESEPTSATELHELRLALKHCRYALEAVDDVAPAACERLLRRLRAVQDGLGEHRDALVARHWLRRHEAALGRATARRLREPLRRQERRLREEAAALSARVLPAYRGWLAEAASVRESATA